MDDVLNGLFLEDLPGFSFLRFLLEPSRSWKDVAYILYLTIYIFRYRYLMFLITWTAAIEMILLPCSMLPTSAFLSNMKIERNREPYNIRNSMQSLPFWFLNVVAGCVAKRSTL